MLRVSGRYWLVDETLFQTLVADDVAAGEADREGELAEADGAGECVLLGPVVRLLLFRSIFGFFSGCLRSLLDIGRQFVVRPLRSRLFLLVPGELREVRRWLSHGVGDVVLLRRLIVQPEYVVLLRHLE